MGVSSARPVTVEGDGTYKQNSFPRLPSTRLRVCPVSIQQFQGVSPTPGRTSHAPGSTGQRNVSENLARLPEMGEKNPATRFPARLSSSGGREPSYSRPLQVLLTRGQDETRSRPPVLVLIRPLRTFQAASRSRQLAARQIDQLTPGARYPFYLPHSAIRIQPVSLSPCLRLSGSPALLFSASPVPLPPHLGHTSPDQSGPQRIFDL